MNGKERVGRQIVSMEHLHSSAYWLNHFQENALEDRIDWEQEPTISPKESALLIPSLQVFQLGLTSSGSTLMAAANKYAQRHQDREYMDVVQHYIDEENGHGQKLRRYLMRLGETPKRRDLGDTLFRHIRGFGTNMELWTISALVVESAAQVYFQAVKDATRCQLLQQVCEDIMTNDREHIRFQTERLGIIYNRKHKLKKALASFAYHLHFKLTYRAIWLGHASVFRAGGITYHRFRRMMHQQFNHIMAHVETSKTLELQPIYMR